MTRLGVVSRPVPNVFVIALSRTMRSPPQRTMSPPVHFALCSKAIAPEEIVSDPAVVYVA